MSQQDRLMPLELQRMQIPKRFVRGYSYRFVDELVQRMITELETLLDELKESRGIADSALRELETYRAQENTLKEAIVLAQKTSDETRANAHREAELIIKDARREAAEMEKTIIEETQEIRWNLDRMRQQKSQFEKRWKSLLEEQLDVLNATKETVQDSYEPVVLSVSDTENDSNQELDTESTFGDFELDEDTAIIAKQ